MYFNMRMSDVVLLGSADKVKTELLNECNVKILTTDFKAKFN